MQHVSANPEAILNQYTLAYFSFTQVRYKYSLVTFCVHGIQGFLGNPLNTCNGVFTTYSQEHLNSNSIMFFFQTSRIVNEYIGLLVEQAP